MSEGRDHGARDAPRQSNRQTRGAESGYLLAAVQVFSDAIADRVLSAPEQFLQRGNIIGHQRSLIARKCCFDFGTHVRQIDFHGATPGVVSHERRLGSGSYAMLRATSSGSDRQALRLRHQSSFAPRHIACILVAGTLAVGDRRSGSMAAKPFHLGWFLQGSSAQAWGESWTGHIGTTWMVPE